MNNEKWRGFTLFVKIVWLIASLIVIFVVAFVFIFGGLFIEDYLDDFYYWWNAHSFSKSCNVWVVKLRWELYSYLIDDDLDYYWNSIFDEVSSEHIRQWIEYFSGDDQFDMIVLDIDSYGWSPYWAEEIMNALSRTNKDTVALIREAGLSAAYYSALWADKIIASKMSDVWSIWVTMSYLSYSDYNKDNWVKYEELATWKFKNSWDPDKELSDEERELFMRDLNIIHDYFVSDVAERRNLDVENVKELADWSSMLWEQALKEWLIDEIWDKNTIADYFLDKYWYEADFCVY